MEGCSKNNGKRKRNECNYSESNTSNSSSNEESNGKMTMKIRKGPWKAEEDQVLLNHVQKYGPRDWSSIRSKGLLLRTGKSCRLRWVNKLRPNLKNGCKFTAEEERIVIELQSQIGNKWATIAKHLAGRTDNDVKNFWSSRQKRLARLLHSQSPRKNHRSSASSSSNSRPRFHQAPNKLSFEGESSTKAQSLNSSFRNSSISTDTDSMKMVPYSGSVAGNYPCFGANNTTYLEPIPLNTYWNKMDFQFPFPPETQELINRLDSGFVSPFTDDIALVNDGGACYFPHFNEGGVNGGKTVTVKHENGSLSKPDSFFDDFPFDVFDQIDPLPSPSN
ncbi:Transcription factor DUO1, partial [Bienertia sinuspersici]